MGTEARQNVRRHPVVTTEPIESPAERTRRRIDLVSVVRAVLAVVGDRPYRFEDNAAARLLGLEAPIDFVYVRVAGDPDHLDDLAVRAAGGSRPPRQVRTVRGGRVLPQVLFMAEFRPYRPRTSL